VPLVQSVVLNAAHLVEVHEAETDLNNNGQHLCHWQKSSAKHKLAVWRATAHLNQNACNFIVHQTAGCKTGLSENGGKELHHGILNLFWQLSVYPWSEK